MMPRISVIVPVFNAENNLFHCVDSILSQTFDDIELLLIDDGSKDQSGDLCDEYARNDSRVRVFHKPNGGVSSARNVGLGNARGEWVTFVDADDYMSTDFFATLISKNADLIVGHHLHYNSNGEFWEDDCTLPVTDVSEKHILRQFLANCMVYNIMRTPWAKLFKRSLVGNMKFDETMKCGEDTAFMQQYLAKCNSISVVNGSDYYYYEDDNKSEKYAMTPEEAVYHLKRIFLHYKKLNIKSLQFEKFLLEYFYSLCKNKMRYHSDKWFGDDLIVKLIVSLKTVVTRKRYLRIQLMRIPVLYDLWLYRSKSL